MRHTPPTLDARQADMIRLARDRRLVLLNEPGKTTRFATLVYWPGTRGPRRAKVQLPGSHAMIWVEPRWVHPVDSEEGLAWVKDRATIPVTVEDPGVPETEIGRGIPGRMS